MAEGLIDERWLLVMPDFRVEFFAARPTWEVGRLADMAERVEPGMTVYDVGSEHGDFSSLYKTFVGPGGSVVFVEPSEPYWPCAKAIWEANGFDHPPRAWFAGFAADTTARKGADFGTAGWPPMADGPVRADPGFQHLAQGDHVSRVTLDDLSCLAGLPDVVVMDIEGAEWHALAGCRDLLAAKAVLVYVSVHEPTMWNWYERTLDDLHGLMAEVGYAGTELPHHGEGETFWRYERAT